MAKLKVTDQVRLHFREPYGEYKKKTVRVSGVGDASFELEGIEGIFVQNPGNDPAFNDRFYRLPFEPGTWFFTRM